MIVRGHGVVLREWTDADVPAMAVLFDEAEIDAWTPLESPFDEAAAARYLVRARTARAEGRALQLAVTEDGGAPLGEVLLFDPKDGTAEMGYAIGAAHRGRGLARAAVLALLDHATAACGLTTFVLRIRPATPPAARSRAPAASSSPAPRSSRVRRRGAGWNSRPGGADPRPQPAKAENRSST